MELRLEPFPFRYRFPRIGKWHRARYLAERHEIADRHPDGWEIIEPAEVRNADPNARAVERFLVLVFLARCVTNCARRHRYVAMNGAAQLYANLHSAVAQRPASIKWYE